VEDGKAIPCLTTTIDSLVGYTPRCARERIEIVLDMEPGNSSHIPDTVETLSAMYAPLLDGDRLLGVITIQSPIRHAYGEREIAIFRTLCAYGAIALANTDAMATLQQAQAQIILQEKWLHWGS